jgi:acetylornithine/N-succinyldiaminopimelate aminotransferase
MNVAKRPPILMVEGHGSYLKDSRGREYLDFVQGWAVNCLGHSPEVVAQALARQATQLINASPSFYNDRACELAELIAAHGFGGRTFFTNCGAEANEGAIKLARKWGKKHKRGAFEFVTMKNAFHGRTLATMSASDKAQWQDLYEPKVPGFVKTPLNDLGALEAALSDRTVAVMIEPIQGEAGVYPATLEFLRGARELTSSRGILLVFDEIQTGIGRTGSVFAYQQVGVVPDIMTLGKGLGGGVPIAALVAQESVCCFEPGEQGGTFNGNPLVTAAGIAVLRAITAPGFLESVRATGEYLRNKLEQLSAKHGQGEVRGRGLLLALALRGVVGPAIAERALEAGLLINAPRDDALRFMPALNVRRAEVDRCLAILDEVFAANR